MIQSFWKQMYNIKSFLLVIYWDYTQLVQTMIEKTEVLKLLRCFHHVSWFRLHITEPQPQIYESANRKCLWQWFFSPFFGWCKFGLCHHWKYLRLFEDPNWWSAVWKQFIQRKILQLWNAFLWQKYDMIACIVLKTEGCCCLPFILS